MGANSLGLLLPVVIATLAMLGAYFPIGTTPPFSQLLSGYSFIFLGLGVSATILFGGPVYAVLAWSWRPIVLSALFGFSLIVGIAIGVVVAGELIDVAIHRFHRRSVTLTSAILEYERLHGTPPATLVDLVPGQLSTLPSTGMSVDPDYEYEPNAGFCTARNRWNLSIRLPGEFMPTDYLIYCPLQDYFRFDAGDQLDIRGDWRLIHND